MTKRNRRRLMESKNWKDAPAYFFEISPNSYRFGMGFYSASPNMMSLFREAIDANPNKFLRVISFYFTFCPEATPLARILSPL